MAHDPGFCFSFVFLQVLILRHERLLKIVPFCQMQIPKPYEVGRQTAECIFFQVAYYRRDTRVDASH